MIENKNILKKINEHLKIDALSVIKSFSWLSGSQAVTILTSFLLSIAFANLLAPETYGTYKYLTSIASIIAISSLGGMGVSFATSVAKGKDGEFSKIIKLKLITGLLGTLGGLAVVAYYLYKQNMVLGYSLAIVSILAPVTDTLLFYNSILQGKKDFSKISKYSATSQIIFSLSILATLIFSKNLYILISVYFISLIIGRYIVFKITLSKYTLNKEHDPETINQGFHLSLNSVISTIATNIDKLIIFTYLGNLELAIYSIATIPVDQIRGVFKNLSTIVLPNYATQEISKIKEGLPRKIYFLIFICLIITFLYVLIAPFIFPFIFPKYSASIPLSTINAFSILAVPALLPSTLLQTKAGSSTYYRFIVISSITQISLLFLGAYYFKLLGIIIAKTVGQLATFIISIYYTKKIS